MSGGASSLTYVGALEGRRVVVKVAPPGVEPVRNRDVLRQARVIRALGPSTVPVPDVLWEDAGAPPEIPPLFVMSFVEGSSLEPLFDVDGVDDPDARLVAERLGNAARTLAALHRFLPPDRLRSRRAGHRTGGGSRPLVDVALDGRPDARTPGGRTSPAHCAPPCRSADPAAIVHGDFRLGNLLAVGERIAAVVDWEIWSVGDPRVDLGWFLLNADPGTYRRPTRYAGSTPPIAELRAVYVDSLGRELRDWGWFVALASFKSAATWSLIVKHNRRHPVPDREVEAMVPALPRLLSRAVELLG